MRTIAPFRKKRLQAYRGRGDIYAWLRTHCHAVAERLAAGEASWIFIAAEMERHGVAGRDGEAPSANAILRVWQRVRRDMESQGETPGQQQERPKPPSRFPKGWIPPIVSESEIPVPAYLRPPGTALVSSPSPPPPVLPERQAGEDLPEPGSMEDLILSMDKADWHLLGGKRRRRTEP